MTTRPLVEFKNVWMAFGAKEILKGVNLEVRSGETLAVIGPSGSGKSTILKLIIGLLAPTSGEIWIKEHSVAEFGEEQWNAARRQMGMVFQYSALFDFLTVGENVAFGLRQHTKLSEEEIQARVKEILAMVGLAGTEEYYPVELSGGMKKRVSLGRAIALNPGLILYDEPTAGLDPVMSNTINELIIKTQKTVGAASVLVTHDMVSACMTADRIAMLYEGEIIAQGTVDEMRQHRHPMVQKFMLGASELKAREKE